MIFKIVNSSWDDNDIQSGELIAFQTGYQILTSERLSVNLTLFRNQHNGVGIARMDPQFQDASLQPHAIMVSQFVQYLCS